MEKNIIQLSRKVSYILRHEPWLYELELNDEGWVPVNELLSALQLIRREWVNITENDLIMMIQQSSKQRHELKNGKIRALYGHSTPDKLLKLPAEPPEILYHGTTPKIALIIAKEGLKPMGRQYVHLSVDTETALQVGQRKCLKSVLLTIKAKEAFQNNVNFYKGNDHVWLADNIAAKYIEQVRN